MFVLVMHGHLSFYLIRNVVVSQLQRPPHEITTKRRSSRREAGARNLTGQGHYGFWTASLRRTGRGLYYGCHRCILRQIHDIDRSSGVAYQEE